MSFQNKRLASFIVLSGAAVFLIGLAPFAAQAAALLSGGLVYLPMFHNDPTNTPTPAPTATPTPTPTPQPYGTGYAVNGSFETSDGATGTGVASWVPWWAEFPKPSGGSFNYAYKPGSFNQECLSTGAASIFIYTGNCSQRILNNWDPWWAGVKQQVNAPAGAQVKLTAYGRAWASAIGYPNPSDTQVNVKMQVAIEPNGNCDQFAGSVIWSAPLAPHNLWQPISVTATVGPSGRVCLILSTDYRGYSRQYLASFWDAVTLTTP